MKRTTLKLTAAALCLTTLGVTVQPVRTMAGSSIISDSACAGISVTLNNYFASYLNPEDAYAKLVSEITETAQPESVPETAPVAEVVNETPAAEAAPVQPAKTASAYKDVAISQVNEYVNIRSEANTEASVVGKIYNNCAATILDTVEGGDGTWYYIKSGTVTGYIKAEFFVTGEAAEAIAKSVGRVKAKTTAVTLRLREKANTESTTLTLLAEGEVYDVAAENVTNEAGESFVKLTLNEDLTGYVSSEYVDVYVEFDEAVSIEEEEAALAEEQRRKEEADEALKKLEEEKNEETEAQATEGTVAPTEAVKEETTAAPETAAPETAAPETAAPETAAPDEGTPASDTVADETAVPEETAATEEVTEAPTEAPAEESSVAESTRDAVVKYALQFVGNPYKWGGTSLTNGADCSGFVLAVYRDVAGISLPHSSRSQANKGTRVSLDSLQPGDLVFYESGGTINHVAMYIGNGQVVHASSSTTGIITSNMYYRTPYCAVSLL